MQEWNACQSSCLSCGKDQDGGGGSPGPTNNNAIVANVIQTPIYVNLYWDTTWDVDNPSMTMAAIDNFTASMVSSSYFGGLQEYGVTGATFAGSFVPDGACTAKAPGSVGLYDPVSASILGFLNCELVNAGIPQGPNVIYNLLLPQGSLESDLFGGLTFCGNGGVSWHFHQTPYTPAGALAVATAYGGETGNFFAFLSGLATGDPALIAAGLSSIGPISAAQLLTSFEGLQGPPFYTIVSVDSRCDPNAPADQNTNGVIANNLMHEMLEAATDPSPSVAAILSGGIANGEIVDKADDANAANSALCAPSTPFQAPPVLGISCPGGISPFFSFICFKGYAPQYWSNASQNCTIGFTSTAMPNISGASIAGTESQLSLTLTGSGFGPTPILQPSGAGGGQPYVGLANLNPSHPWEAGINGGESSPGLTLHSWSDTNIVLSGLQFDGGDLVLSPTDSLAAWVCNPASGQCSVNSQAVSSTVSGTPRIQVIVEDAWNANVPLDIAIDGVTVARNIDNNGGSGWLTGLAPNTPFTVGPSHKVVAKPTTKAFVTTVFLGGCAADGSFVLAEGDNRTCIVSNSAGQCPTGQHCCGTSSTSAGCSTGCISNATSCSKGCPSGTVCCGIISGTGSCRAGVCAVPGKCP
jgi:hypothetical protein